MEDYEFYHTDNGLFIEDAMMPIDGITDFGQFMEQQSLIDILEQVEYYKANNLFVPDHLEPYVSRYTPNRRQR